ncbi:MAG: heme o synthase [Gaiellaceae bacterium]
MTSVASALVLRRRTVLWRDVLVLLKLRIDALVVCVALAAAVAGGTRRPGTLAVLAVACFAASAGASALNHYFERETDALMKRTRGRPLPSGRIAKPHLALWLGVGLIAASQAAVPVLGVPASLYLLAGAVTYALVYTRWLKPRTPYSIVIGGAAGSFSALAGWQTGSTTLAAAPLLLAAVLFLWTPSHFWSLAIVFENDYRRAALPMLPAVAGARRTAAAIQANTIVLVAASLVLAPFLGVAYGAAAVLGGVGFLVCTSALVRHPDPPHAWRAFKASGLYLLTLLVGVVLSAI